MNMVSNEKVSNKRGTRSKVSVVVKFEIVVLTHIRDFLN